MIVGLMGLSFSNPNRGVCALAYSCVYLLEMCARKENKHCRYILFVPVEDKSHLEFSKVKEKLNIPDLEISICNTALKNQDVRRKAINVIKTCDVVLDMSLGDSFSDIYGTTRFIYYSYFKYIAIKKSSRFALGPQTYGPFNSRINKMIARWIINNSDVVMSRDDLSATYINGLCSLSIRACTDVAFFLPYNELIYDMPKTIKRVGLNVSMLLWSGGYKQNNDFSLKLNYREFIVWLIEYLSSLEYEIHLIPHVVDGDNCSTDNDVIVCKEINAMYPNTIFAPLFDDPISAKSYIANMDLFIGSRMHAAIGAISSGVPTIPVSYSRKFEGLFGTLGYDIGINGKSDSTANAINKVKSYINDLNQVRMKKDEALINLENKKREIINEFIKVLA